ALILRREDVVEDEARASVSVPPLAALDAVVLVVGDRLDVLVGVLVLVLTALPMVAAALDDVPKVRDDAGFDEHLPMLVEVDAPGIARTLGELLEALLGRVIAPDRGVHEDALLVGGAGFADLRVGEHAVASVEPAVGSPHEAVERLVLVVVAPAVKHHLRRAVGLPVAVLVGNEEQRGGRAHPNATEAD